MSIVFYIDECHSKSRISFKNNVLWTTERSKYSGHGASEEIVDKTDLMTEMLCLKHFMEKGVTAR